MSRLIIPVTHKTPWLMGVLRWCTRSLKEINDRTGYPNYVWFMVVGFLFAFALLFAGYPAYEALLQGRSLHEVEPGVYHGRPVQVPLMHYLIIAYLSVIPFAIGLIGYACHKGWLDRFD